MTPSATSVAGRIGELQTAIAIARSELGRTREYLLKAAYYHDLGLVCPRCKKPFGDFMEGEHACLAIERRQEGTLVRELMDMELELAELRSVAEELEAGVPLRPFPLPEDCLRRLAPAPGDEVLEEVVKRTESPRSVVAAPVSRGSPVYTHGSLVSERRVGGATCP